MALAAIVGLVALLAAGGSAGAAAGNQRPRLSLSVPGQIAAGSRLLATGKVTPAATSGRVELQLREGGSWHRIARGAPRRGHFKLRATLTASVSTARVRAALMVGKRRVAISPVRTVRVQATPTPLPPSPTPPPGPTPTPTPTPSPPGADPLSAASLMSTIDQYASLPNHLSGTANSAAALDEFEAAAGAAGLRLGEQAFAYPRFAPTAVSLTLGAAHVPVSPVAIAPLLYSGTTGSGGITAPLFNGGDGTAPLAEGEVAGKIVVISVTYQNNSKAPKLDPAIERAVKGKALALVAVTQGVGDYPKWEDVNARRGTGNLPVLLVGKRSGAAVVQAATEGREGTLTLAADTGGSACDRDVWGELEGSDPSRRVFVATPSSSFTPSASEHGSAYAIVLGLARHYAALPQSQRPETLVFMALGGHEVGWLGLQALLASPRGEWLRGADGYVHLGSALGAPTAREEPDGTIVTTTAPDPTGRLHESENPLLTNPVIEDFTAAGVPTPETPPHVASGGEQTSAYAAGIPTASFSGASLYFHTAGDLPSVVDPTILAKDADAFRRTVDTITAIPPGRLKAENGAAEAFAKSPEFSFDKRAPVNPTLGGGGVLGSGGVGGPAATPVSSCP